MKKLDLENEVQQKLEELKNLPPGSEEYKAVLDCINVLCTLQIEGSKASISRDDLWIKYGLEAVMAAAAFGFNMVWMRRGFKFEQTGVYSSTTFKQLWSKFRIGR